MKNANWMGLAAVMACGLAGCSGVQSRVHDGRLGEVIDQKPDQGMFIEAIGIGGADPSLPSVTQRKALARDAAIVKAQYELLSMVKGVTVAGGITVARALEANSVLQTKLNAVIAGAEIRKTEFTTDNGCVVTLRLPKNRLEELMNTRFQ